MKTLYLPENMCRTCVDGDKQIIKKKSNSHFGFSVSFGSQINSARNAIIIHMVDCARSKWNLKKKPNQKR